MSFDLTGKRAIVTGASGALGSAIKAALEAAGAEVFAPANACYDLRTYGTASGIMTEAKIYGSLDILVNCAAVIGPIGHANVNQWDEWRRCLQVNLIAPAELTALAIHWMKEAETKGSIINISGGGACNPRPNYSAYATSKAGLVRFSETVAEECRESGIRINCVSPGNLGQGMSAGESGNATAENAAQLVTWLASDVSRPVTGKLISAVYDPWPNLERNLAKGDDMYTLRRVTP